MTSVFTGFRSAPTLALATSKSCRKDSTRIERHMTSPSSMLPLICHASAFSATQCCGSWTTINFFWAAKLTPCNLAAFVHANPREGARRAAMLPPVSAANIPTPRTVSRPSTSSLLCTSILRHWQEPFLFNMGQSRYFPRGCCVLWEKPRCRLPHCLPLDHSQSNSSLTLILPFVVEELMKRWPRPQRRLAYQLRSAASKS